jgi:hypothetical protein
LTSGFTLLFNYFDRFDEILAKTNPKLSKKLHELHIEKFLFVSKWIQTLFTYNFRLEIVTRIWDLMLLYNVDVIVLISIAIVEYKANEIVRAKHFEEVLKIFDTLYVMDNSKIDGFINYIINYIKKYKNLI